MADGPSSARLGRDLLLASQLRCLCVTAGAKLPQDLLALGRFGLVLMADLLLVLI